MLKKKHALLYITTVLVLSMVFASPALAAKKFFAVATGGTGGTYYPLGGALAQALSSKIPDLINGTVRKCLHGKSESHPQSWNRIGIRSEQYRLRGVHRHRTVQGQPCQECARYRFSLSRGHTDSDAEELRHQDG